MKRFDYQAQVRLAWLLLVLFTLFYAAFMSCETVLRYETFKATAFDLGNLDQVIWNTAHGRLFAFTNQGIDYYGPPTRLAVHFEPIILLLALLYVIHADPRVLLVFQTIVLALGTLPVFLLTRKHIPQWPLLAALLVGAYLSMPSLLGLNLFDFHPVSLATPLLLYAFLALEHRRWGWAIVACILAASTKEDVPFAVAMLGILVIWRYKAPRLGTLLFVGGLLWGLMAFLVIIPHFYPGAQHNNFWYRYESLGLGTTPGQAVTNILLHPWLIFVLLSTFISVQRLYYLAGLLRNSGFLALLAPEWLLPALPSLAINLLSTDPLLYSGIYQYNATIIPCVMLASIYGIRRAIAIWESWRGEKALAAIERGHETFWQSMRWLLAPVFWLLGEKRALLMLTSLQASASSLVATPIVIRSRDTLSERFEALRRRSTMQWQRLSARMEPIACQTALPRLQWFVYGWIVVMCVLNYIVIAPDLNSFWPDHLPGSREQHIEQLLAMIPPDASVSAGDNLNPHLTERQYITVFPSLTYASSDRSLHNPVQYVIVDLNDVFPEDRVATANTLYQLVNSGQFRVLARAEGVILLERRT
jgi:uncharacterized membrane protein